MRRGEILNLRWDQVDWNGNVVRLEKRQTKGKKGRVAPLYGELRAWLEMGQSGRDPDCPFVVAWKGAAIREVKTAWNKARARAGVPELLIHDLRRAAARNMIRAGVPEKLVLEIVGWKTRTMLDRYNIIDERDVHAAGEKMNRFDEESARLDAAKEGVRTKVRTVGDPEKKAAGPKYVILQ
jgi:integrase